MASKHLNHGKKLMISQNKEYALLAEELLNAQNRLNEITGQFTSDDLLGKIFSSFCIGK
jgi:tRNA modification GTPase